MTSLVCLRLKVACAGLNAGETAGFPPEEAAALVKQELAVPGNAEAEALLSRMGRSSVLDAAVTRDVAPETRPATIEDTVSHVGPKKRR